MKILLDTNAYSALLRGESEAVERVRKAERVLMSKIVVGELIFGFRNGTRFQQNFERLESFLANRFVELVPVTFTMADRDESLPTSVPKESPFRRTTFGLLHTPSRPAQTCSPTMNISPV